MEKARSKSPSPPGSDDVQEPKVKRVRGPDASNDVYAFQEDGNSESKETTKKQRRAGTRKLKEVKPEPEPAQGDEEDRSVENTEAPAPKRNAAGQKRKNPRTSGPAAGSSSETIGTTLKDSTDPKRPRRVSRKLPSSTHTLLSIPSVEGGTAVLVSGDNETGQLGQERNCAVRFVSVPGVEEKIVTCAAGGMHSLLLSDKGNVFSFGCNDDGSLGRETEEEEDCFKPGRILFDGAKIAKIAAGNIHSLALSTDCRVFIWGSYRDNSGAFGISPQNTSCASEPLELTVPDSIVDIACGAEHTLMLTEEGTIYTMGCAEHGRLGRIRKSHCCRENRRARQVMLTPFPIRMPRRPGRGLKQAHFNAIWAGRYCTFARNADGSIWGCGLNNFGQLGEVHPEDHDDNFVYQPVELRAFNLMKEWVQICGGEQHTLALDSEGTVYSMGRALYGRLGLGEAEASDPDVKRLTPVPGLEARVVSIAAGDHCSFALDDGGQLWSWGRGSNMLGQGDRDKAAETDIFVPTLCTSKALKDKKVIRIGAGSNHALCVISV